MKRGLVWACLTLGALAAAEPVRAEMGWVCKVVLVPGTTSASPKRVIVEYSSEEDCNGTFVTTSYCERGATSNICATPASGWQYAAEDLRALFLALTNAANHEMYVIYTVGVPCNGGATTCAGQLLFTAEN